MHRYAAVCLASLSLLTIPTSSRSFAPRDRTLAPPFVKIPAAIKTASAAELQRNDSSTLHLALSGLRREADAEWLGSFDVSTGVVRRAFGAGIPFFAGKANRLAAPPSPPSLSDARTVAWDFVDRHGALFGNPEKAEWSISAPGSQALDGGRIWPIRFVRAVAGVPVENAQIQLVLNHGNLVYINANGLGSVTTNPKPSLSEHRTWTVVTSHLASSGVAGARLAMPEKSQLVFVPVQSAPSTAVSYRLVRQHDFTLGEGYAGSWRARVDAHTGELHALEDMNSYSCALDPAQTQGRVRGGVRPAGADDAEEVRHFIQPIIDGNASSSEADTDGFYIYAGLGASSSLSGRYFDVACMENYDSGSLCVDQPSASTSGDGIIDFGMGGIDEAQDASASSTPADRTAGYHLNVAHALASKWISRGWLDSKVGVNVNIEHAFGGPAHCNAFWDGLTLNFARSGGGCANTGEIRDVMQHEWGHGLDTNDGVFPTDKAFGEAYADHIALFVDHDSCIGQSFEASSDRGPYCESNPSCSPLNASCTGVRNIDEKRSTRGLLSIANVNSKCGFGSCLGVLGRECHCEGEIYGQAAFHLARNLLEGSDYATGSGLAGDNPAYSEVAAWYIHERLFFNATAIMASYAPSGAQTVGTSAYDAYMLVDDDDGNLANGTPNAEYINQAFSHHGMQETPPVSDSQNCTPPGDPLISVEAQFSQTGAGPRVEISWPDTGASFYTLQRNLKLSDVWLPVRSQVQGGASSHTIYDEPVQLGEEYNYVVIAVSDEGCPSAGSSIASVSVALPDASAAIGATDDTTLGSDGDGLVEPGELVSIRVDLSEVGGLVDLLNASVELHSQDPHVTITSPGPIAYGSVSAGGTLAGPSSFEVAVSVSHGCRESVALIAAITADNGCLLRPFALDIASSLSGCAPRSGGEALPAAAVVADDSVDPSCSDADGVIDNTELVAVELTVDNVGDAPTTNVVVDLQSVSPALAIQPPASVVIPFIAALDSAVATFNVRASGASCEATAELLVTVDSDQNIAPFDMNFELVLERDSSAAALDADFETDFNGWTARGFERSSARANGASGWAAYAGAGSGHPCDSSSDGAGACSTLTSPAFVPSAASELIVFHWYRIEDFSGQWWDRANVHVIDVASGDHTLIAPSGGRAYDGGDSDIAGHCHLDGEEGWAGSGSGTTWASSTFDLSGFASEEIQIEINYNTDSSFVCEGLYIDDIAITNAITLGCDELECAVCGNGNVEGLEECDDGGESPTCDADCSLAVCGDGTTNVSAEEDCDDAGESPTCDDDCSLAACGDGTTNVSAEEECDDAGESPTCDDDCSLAVCGDGTTNVSAEEDCDDAGESPTCDADCSLAACGDGTTNVSAEEDCDDAGESPTCDADCSLAACGDGTTNVSAEEDCDDAGESPTCDDDCSLAACGDGTTNVSAEEDCDDAGESPTCDADCSLAVCGDGTPNVSAEEDCDDAGESPTCDADCTLAECGDNTVNTSAEEECDDGNTLPGDSCSPSCELTCEAGTLSRIGLLQGVKDGLGGAKLSWTLDPAASLYHVNSVSLKTDLSDPRRSPGQGVAECDVAAPISTCTIADAVLAAEPLLFYQTLAACGAGGLDEGPF